MSFATGLKTIVVATDLDGRADAALEYARKLATAYGARIVLAHGLDPVDYASIQAVPGKVLSSMTELARAALDRMAADLIREGIHSHSEIRQGEVAQMLVDVARQYEAGLIVLGTEGRQGAGPVLVGAVAEYLVRMAQCPVLAVAADFNAGAFRLSDRNQFERRIRHPGKNSWRYRNKFQIEHPLGVKDWQLSWFAGDEVFYDWAVDRWVRNRFSVGMIKVFNKHFTQDLFYLRQNDGVTVPGDLNVIGTTLRFRL